MRRRITREAGSRPPRGYSGSPLASYRSTRAGCQRRRLEAWPPTQVACTRRVSRQPWGATFGFIDWGHVWAGMPEDERRIGAASCSLLEREAEIAALEVMLDRPVAVRLSMVATCMNGRCGTRASAGPAARPAPRGPVARAAASLRRPAAATATPAAQPVRTSRPGSRTPGRAGTSRLGANWSPTIRCPRSTAGSGYHPCESVCNRAELDSAVSIHSVERFLGDLALEQGWQFDPPPVRSGKRVLVVGAGPCGLSAAYHLSRLGLRRGDPRLRRGDGRDDALRHPGLPSSPATCSPPSSTGSRRWV